MSKRKAPKNTFWRGGVLWGRVKVKGVDIKWTLRTSDVETAKRRIKQEREREIARVYYGDHRKTYEDTVAAWTEHITEHVSATTVKRYGVSLNQLAPFLRPLFLDEISAQVLNEVVRSRRNHGASNATIRRDLTALSAVLTFAEDEEWIDANPALSRLRRLRERRDPIVLPEAYHILRVMQRAPGMIAKLIEAAWATGCRLNELVSAERGQLDHARKQLLVRGKGNKIRVVDLDGWGFDMFRGLPATLGGKWLFWHGDGEPYRNLSSRFKVIVAREAAAAQKAERDFRPFRFHDLRHRHAVDWLKAGRSIYDLQQRLGHSSVKTTEIYLAYLTPEEARVAKFGVPQKGEPVQRFAVLTGDKTQDGIVG